MCADKTQHQPNSRRIGIPNLLMPVVLSSKQRTVAPGGGGFFPVDIHWIAVLRGMTCAPACFSSVHCCRNCLEVVSNQTSRSRSDWMMSCQTRIFTRGDFRAAERIGSGWRVMRYSSLSGVSSQSRSSDESTRCHAARIAL